VPVPPSPAPPQPAVPPGHLPVPTQVPNLPVPVNPHPPVPVPTGSQPPHVVVDLPPELLHHTDPLISVLSGVGIGAVIAAIISAGVLWLVEGRRQKGENMRKLMELQRLDQRQWNEDIREAFKTARVLLTKFRWVVGDTRLYAHFADNRDDMTSFYNQLIELQSELAGIRDDLRIIAEDDLVDAFDAGVEMIRDYIGQFGVEGDHVTYKVETVKSTKPPDWDGLEERMLAAVKAALRTPREIDS
jgi:hypothetical protein